MMSKPRSLTRPRALAGMLVGLTFSIAAAAAEENLLTIDNGAVRVGIDRAKGGSITWLSWRGYPQNCCSRCWLRRKRTRERWPPSRLRTGSRPRLREPRASKAIWAGNSILEPVVLIYQRTGKRKHLDYALLEPASRIRAEMDIGLKPVSPAPAESPSGK